MSLFDEIRDACAAVAADGAFVQIDADRLESFADEIAPIDFGAAEADPALGFAGNATTRLAFVLTLDAINFGSGWFPLLRKRDGMSGYRTLATSLRERFDAHGPWSPAALSEIDSDDVALALGQEGANAEVAKLLELYTGAWRDLGRLVLGAYGGRWEGLVESAAGSAERLVQRLAAMPFYRDVTTHRERRVPFYKRGQITVYDLARAFDFAGPGAFAGLDALTIFADNLVPHVLRVEGVLAYDAGLVARIEREELLPSGSTEEVEIRALALDACERLVAALAARGRRTSAAELDGWLWSRGQAPRFKTQPRHRTRCVYY